MKEKEPRWSLGASMPLMGSDGTRGEGEGGEGKEEGEGRVGKE